MIVLEAWLSTQAHYKSSRSAVRITTAYPIYTTTLDVPSLSTSTLHDYNTTFAVRNMQSL